MGFLERFIDPADYVAHEALSAVLQTWQRPGFALNVPLLLENRIEILSQAASAVGDRVSQIA
jgi:hypothetical protein